LGGAIHDYFSGMISSRHDGASIVAMTGEYMGKIAKIIMTFFSVLLLILVTAVFVVSPASLLQDLSGGMMPATI
jgi:carbon starvation protein CstA